MTKEELKVGGHLDEKILLLFNIGFSQKKIETIIELPEQYVRRRKRVLILQGKLTEKKIETARKDIEKEANKRRKRIAKMKEKFDLEVIRIQIEYAKAKLKLGEPNEKDMEMLSQLIVKIPKLIEASNIHFVITYYTRNKEPYKALVFIEQCMENSNNTLLKDKLEKAREEIFNHLKREDVETFIEEKENSKEVTQRRRQVRKMLEFNIDLDEEVAQEYLDYVMMKVYLEKLERSDLRTVKKLIQMSETLINETNVRFVVDYLVNQGKQREAYTFVSECESLVNDNTGKQEMMRNISEELGQWGNGSEVGIEFRKRLKVTITTGTIKVLQNSHGTERRDEVGNRVSQDSRTH